MYDLQEKAPATYTMPQQGDMNVPGLIIATSKLMSDPSFNEPLKQVHNVATLPGIVGYSIAMPDIHWGYGFPIGGVAAMDPKDGVISPGGVGYDINCGVRMALLPILFEDLDPKKRFKLIRKIFDMVPAGVGSSHKNIKKLSDNDYQMLCSKGARWSIEQGYGFEEDLLHIENEGTIEGSDAGVVSSSARDRARKQMGTLGSGNHFIEIGSIEKVVDSPIAQQWGVIPSQAYILIHSGSRGFGHQICQDTISFFNKRGYAEGLPDRQLVAAPIDSDDGRRYFSSMAAAANFAFNNRQQILHLVRLAIDDVLGIPPEQVPLLYDITHNIAKFETHENRRLCIHRKGATRALGPGDNALSAPFKKTGQPVLVPGDMGRASYLMAGLGNKDTWCSACHGAGRACSRMQALKNWKNKDPLAHMHKEGVEVIAASKRTIAEEMPDAYKPVDDVVDAVQRAGLAKQIARLRPYLVIKG